MFTGLIENQGKVLANHRNESSSRLMIASSFESLKAGESIAVNGVCLTLLATDTMDLSFDVSPETMKLTALGGLSSGDCVNLERAMFASTRFGGHYVSGHVDVTARVQSLHSIDDCIEMELAGFDAHSMLYLIPKGSVTVDGVSLTINAVENQTITLMLVPHTLSHTTLSLLKAGQQVNIEFDYLTRIVAHQLQLFGKLNDEVTL